MLVRPKAFHFNVAAAGSNYFMSASSLSNQQQLDYALRGFDNLTELLDKHKVNLHIFDDQSVPSSADAIFPNNWVSFHEEGKVFIYPMQLQHRRNEKNQAFVKSIEEKGFLVKQIIDLSEYEASNQFLEGTGSMVFDYANHLAYACLSVRTNPIVLQKFACLSGFSPVVFKALDNQNQPIYHTNVMLCIGEKFAIVCAESIKHESSQKQLFNQLTENGRDLIKLDYQQLNSFAGNCLNISNRNADSLLVMSSRAFSSLQKKQIALIEKHAQIIYCDIDHIEKIGGGGVRCMMTEIRLPRK